MYTYATRGNLCTPQEIREIGLKEGQTHARRDAGDHRQIGAFEVPCTEFAKLMRSDPKFYFKTESEVLEAYRALGPAHRPVAGESLSYPAPYALRHRACAGKYGAR